MPKIAKLRLNMSVDGHPSKY